MKIRPRLLPPGWYPEEASAVTSFIKEAMKQVDTASHPAAAGIVPHAGWYYSGSIACRVIAGLDRDAQTVVVIGGHLPADNTLLAAPEDGFATPLGNLQSDSELLAALKSLLRIQEDGFPDNTVEIQLPFVKYFFPSARLVWMRAAPSQIAESLGRALKTAAEKLSRKVVVVGSTDLTHYGSNYGFTHQGQGVKALSWVKEVNDKRFLDACLEMDTGQMLSLANGELSACSAGGAAAAVSFAGALGITKGRLVDYQTSYDVHPAESFVGYGGVLYQS